ncbi:MAG: cytochrome c5 family protein [Cellvibrionales bacterium]|nr:cytochrome c5 family protein [Cellvibrionales bacterium]
MNRKLPILWKPLLLAALIGLSATVLANQQKREAQIAARLAPVGALCMAGEPCAAAAPGAVAAGEAREPQQIYDTYCMACHTTGAAGSPVLGDADAWAVRLEKGLDSLYQNAINGIGAMPAKGLCMDCSEADIQATIDYILEKSG